MHAVEVSGHMHPPLLSTTQVLLFLSNHLMTIELRCEVCLLFFSHSSRPAVGIASPSLDCSFVSSNVASSGVFIAIDTTIWDTMKKPFDLMACAMHIEELVKKADRYFLPLCCHMVNPAAREAGSHDGARCHRCELCYVASVSRSIC